ncbi:tetratricopeptide repeat protein [Methylobacterium brachythecii]|uniref:Localization factor PodJL n=2 Tax=Methylobacterium brachythecii TaxID=1176177 RepID=A0A7W6ALH4_9HYPH|nr:tetratricopeptide repeat protein [Methylobacterium brachythecii]MBB3903389.1 localization factor PodJL [Methylobacterium brachythecii]
MRRTATLSLEGFDPDVIEAAREVAQRAGVPLETWIASVVAPEKSEAKPAAARQRNRAAAREAAVPEPQAERPAPEPAPTPAPAAVTPPKPKAVKAPAPARAPAVTAAEPATASITEMMRRLDALDRTLKEDRSTANAEAPATANVDHVAERLAEIERRMGEMTAQIGGPRPLGRRGRPISAEMRDAVDEVRRRQRELDADGSTAQPFAEAAPPSPAITELQAETARLRESLGTLATGRDVGALEKAMRSLSEDVHRSRDPAEFAAPIEAMRRQAETLAEEFADNVQARLAGEVERLARRADGAASSHADQSALDGVHRELDEIRQMIAGLAGPERIQSLAQGLQALSGQIADLQSRVDVNPVRDLIGRLETIGETLHRPAAPPAELASMHALLRGIAEKVDRVGSGGGNLDALESHVVSLAERLDTRAVDPAVAGLERTMGELLTQISALRDDTHVEAAVERATRRALSEAVGQGGLSPAPAKFDAFRADLDELRARQISADQRMQATMDGLNSVLTRLVDRLGMSDSGPVIRPPVQDESVSLGQQLRASTTLGAPKIETIPVSAPRSRTARRAQPALEPASLGDELLEPGAGRPSPARSAVPEASAAPAGDIKSSFIAAARRAAQAAQADIAAEAPSAPERREASAARVSSSAPPAAGVVGRLLGSFEKRRRPLILGLAAVVLVLGALQAYQMGSPAGQAEPVKPVAAAKPVPVEPPAAEAAVDPAASAPAVAPSAGPQTTQSIADASPSVPKAAAPSRIEESAPAQAAIPKVATMASLGRELSSVPAGLATLKQSALDGDGAAIYELAAREADGRGMPRDLAVAAKLYEKLADAGYAPAQFKLGSFFEKGSGVIRDLGQAKTWYGRAADRGNIRAMHNLAVLHAENPSASGKPDFATASTWFRRAAEYGVRDSQYNLAVLYARGLGVGQDLIQSYAWFSAAAVQGDEEAGKKRDDVAAKLAPKDLAAAKAVASAYKPKVADPSANDLPPAKAAAPAAMSLLGAPPPGSPTGSFARSGPRAGV